MGWHYRDPMTFPAVYHQTILRAADAAPHPVLFREVPTSEVAKEIQKIFRWFKWCAKHERSAATAVRQALENYDFRCSFEAKGFKLLLYVRARPTLLGDLLMLNPEIAKELSSFVND